MITIIPNYISYNNCSGISSISLKPTGEETMEHFSRPDPTSLMVILWATDAGEEPSL